MNFTGLLIALVALITGGVAGMAISDNKDDTILGMGFGQQNRQGALIEAAPIPEDYVSVRPAVSALPVQDLSVEEEEDLLYMREEEKLARDVYMTLYEQWGTPIFANIAQSEQTHTEAIRNLLEKYDLSDPVADDTIGVFENDTLAGLYDSLVEQGSESLAAALTVGATIEDLDIKDLADALERTDNEDITLVYENLQRGSRNHLRSFTTQLERQGEAYEPTYISQEEYESIVSSERERGAGMGGGQNMKGDSTRGQGDGQGRGGGRGWGGNY